MCDVLLYPPMFTIFHSLCIFVCSFFFFQAEDGIRDIGVTGVQTCALPISVGWPAAQTGPAVGSQSWFTAAMLVRLNRLKASAMRSRRNRSPKLIPLEMRRSNWKNPGDVKASRPSVPKQPNGAAGETKGCLELVRQTVGRPKLAPGMNGEVVAPPRSGRTPCELNNKRRSSPVMTLNGLPDETSTSGANVKSLKNAWANELPPL